MVSRLIVIASIAWPMLLGVTVGVSARSSPPRWTAVVYLAASRICHQRPERSFHTAGVQWPVCGRCSGLYLSAPVGAVAAIGRGRRRVQAIRIVALAGVPTVLTLAIEWLGLAPVSNLVRALAAVPLGAAIAFVIVRAAAGASKAIE